MIYYFMLICAAALFSVQFFFQKRFEGACGTDVRSALVFSVGTGFGIAEGSRTLAAEKSPFWSEFPFVA